MSKEYLEALERLYNCNDDDYTLGYQQHDYKLLQKALQRLEEINNANSGEALEDLEIAKKVLIKMFGEKVLIESGVNFDTIEQALLKAQELEVENSKYKELEEGIGCPVDVIAKLRKTNYIYRDDGIVFGFIGINFNDEDKLILYNDDEWNTFTSDLRLIDYKKTWFLRKDKSE